MENKFKGVLVVVLFAVIFGLNALISCSGPEKEKEKPQAPKQEDTISEIDLLNEKFDLDIEATDSLSLDNDSI